MLNFTVGPVMMPNIVRQLGTQEIPYFRTSEFSALMKDNERLMIKYMNAPKGSRCIFLTGSGTAAMEATVINTLNKNDNVIIVNGGSFGQRFVELCKLHKIPFEQIRLQYGQSLTRKCLENYKNSGFTGFLVNMHETSTGVLYDMNVIGEFCKHNGLFLISDCISSFLADEFDMAKTGVNVAITGSQKALALPPGISIAILDQNAIDRLQNYSPGNLYFSFELYLKNMERGQTPFTPAVLTLLQLNKRLHSLEQNGGIETEIFRIRKQAEDFRSKIRKFDLKMLAETPSNAVTSLEVPDDISASKIFELLKNEYGIFICPNGGDLKEKVFRVGHIGNLSIEDNDTLISAFDDLKRRGYLR